MDHRSKIISLVTFTIALMEYIVREKVTRDIPATHSTAVKPILTFLLHYPKDPTSRQLRYGTDINAVETATVITGFGQSME